MSLSPEARVGLATQQAALVTALTARGEPPAGFDSVRLLAAAAALARKRARAAAPAWPGMALALGHRFGELFAVYAESVSLPPNGGPLAENSTEQVRGVSRQWSARLHVQWHSHASFSRCSPGCNFSWGVRCPARAWAIEWWRCG